MNKMQWFFVEDPMLSPCYLTVVFSHPTKVEVKFAILLKSRLRHFCLRFIYLHLKAIYTEKEREREERESTSIC